MDALIIEATAMTPKVRLYPNGDLYIEGKSHPEDPVTFYTPIIEWIKDCKAVKMTAEFYFEYINTSSSKIIFSILKLIKNNLYAKDIRICWLYDKDDEEIYDLGCDFQEEIELPFTFNEYAENNLKEE